MATAYASDSSFVRVEMPSESGADPLDDAEAQGAAVDGGDGPAEDEEREHNRSLLKTLWSEATSTTDLPSPRSSKDHRLHHRRGANNAGSKASPGSSKYARKSSAGGTGARRGGGRDASSRLYRVSRGARVAKRVWLAALSALAFTLLIAALVILYWAIVGIGGAARNNAGGGGGNFGTLMKNGMPIMGLEDQEARMTLEEARSHVLAPVTLHSIDASQYTLRINTWQRNEQLLLSINHHAKCEGVKEIQVVWCDAKNEPPSEILHHKSGKVKIEKHAINSLNERFKVLIDPPTLGVLSLDDDVLRPCVALDAAFVRWTRHPDRMVGFDARTHVVDVEFDKEKPRGKRSTWKYGYMSTTESSNRYSITLPRASFIHRDYLDLYVMALPRPIYSYVAQNLECEDVAMSFLVSSLTGGEPPLLADYWAVKSMVKLYSEKKISGGSKHKSTRDACVNDFAEMLGLKEDGKWPLTTARLLRSDHFFGYGSGAEDWSEVFPEAIDAPGLQEVVEKMQELQTMSSEDRMDWLNRQRAETMLEALSVGMIEKTQPWKDRWG